MIIRSVCLLRLHIIYQGHDHWSVPKQLFFQKFGCPYLYIFGIFPFPCIYLSSNIIALGDITKEAWPSPNWHLYDSWRSSDMFFQRRLLNKQSIPPGHRRKSNMIIKSGHIEQPKVFFLKNKPGTFCWKQRQKSQKIYIEEGIFW